MTNEPDVQEIIDEIAAESPVSREEIEELLDVDVIRVMHGEITEENLRHRVASVEKSIRRFGHPRMQHDDPEWTPRFLDPSTLEPLTK